MSINNNNDEQKEQRVPLLSEQEQGALELLNYKIDKHLINCATFRRCISKLDFESRDRETVKAPLLEALGINSYDHLEKYQKDIFIEAFKLQIENGSLNMTLNDFIQHLKKVKPKQMDIIDDFQNNLGVLKKELDKIRFEFNETNDDDDDDEEKIWFLYDVESINDKNRSEIVKLKTKLIYDGFTMNKLVDGKRHNFKNEKKSKVFVFYDKTLANKFDSDLIENAENIYQKVGLEMYKDYLTNEFTRKPNERKERRFFTIPINGCINVEYYWLSGDSNEYVYNIFNQDGTINEETYNNLLVKLK